MRRVLLSLFATLAFALAPTALAVAAPGSAVDEYQEHVPGGGGDQPSDEVGGGGGGGGALPPGTFAALEAQGADGQAAANLAEATAPNGRHGNTGAEGSGSTAGEDAASNGTSGGGGIGELLNRLVGGSGGGDGDEGMGAALPLILGLSALAAILFAIGRRRSHAGGA